MPALDPGKLKENALTSIRLGIEDFQKSQAAVDAGGDPARALSGVRNLFSGVLLLFKYKIAISVEDPEDAEKLIFNPPEVLPHANGEGSIEWKQVGKFKRTTATIKKRFEGFEIEVDWETINQLQECRNHLEHLHPANTLGEVADFVAELFPILRDFVQMELNAQPAEHDTADLCRASDTRQPGLRELEGPPCGGGRAQAVYTAATVEAAQAALLAFEQSDWGKRYPPIAASWHRAWDRVIPFFAFPPAIPATSPCHRLQQGNPTLQHSRPAR